MDMGSLHNDQHLFKQIATGDERAFRQVFHAYNAKLHPFVLKVVHSESVAEDIIQETFLRLWLHRAEVAEMEYPASWLYKVASNLSLTRLRSQAAEVRRLQQIACRERVEPDHVIESISAKEIQMLLIQAIDQLPPKRQHIYKLSREQGLSYEGIAKELHISPNTVKNQLVSAFKFIKEYLYQTKGITVSLLVLIFSH